MAETLTYVIDPLNILTMGMTGPETNDIWLPNGPPLNLITDGFVTVILEEEIIPPEPEEPKGGGGIDDWQEQLKKWERQKKKKKISAKVIIGGEIYEDSVIIEDLTITVRDVKLQLSDEDNNIKIKIILPEKYSE